jgi:AcrR family transcriptional regulator
MTDVVTTSALPVRRRDRQLEETRRDLAFAAFELARRRGLANVRVPEIARAAGVSTRTFNNYFASKEQAIVWPAGRRAALMAATLRARPAAEPLADALVATMTDESRSAAPDLMPARWLRDFRALVVREPALQGEYLVVAATAERDLGAAIADRAPARGLLYARVLAAMVVAAERAAVMHWMATRSGMLPETVRTAVAQAVAGIEPER